MWRDPERVYDSCTADAVLGRRLVARRRLPPHPRLGLFEEELEKVGNDEIVAAFAQRLREVAGFANVPDPLPMKNSQGAVVYYLYFASQKDVANKIVKDIFRKHSSRRG